MIPVDSIQQRGSSILKPTGGTSQQATIKTDASTGLHDNINNKPPHRISPIKCLLCERVIKVEYSYPVVFIHINTTVDEHLHNISVSLTAGQGQCTFPPFGQEVWISTLQWWMIQKDNQRVNKKGMLSYLNYTPKFNCPYILEQKLDDSDLSMCSCPHQGGEAFLILEIDHSFYKNDI